MKTTTLAALLCSVLAVDVAVAQSGLRAALSGRGTTAVTLSYPRGQVPAGASATEMTISIDYGQPHLRGRSLHTDSLVPYDSVWRTGANSATTLKSDVDLTIGGVAVAKGNYLVYTLPTRAGWTLILQRDLDQEPTQYDRTHDAARIPLRRRELATPLESLTFWLIPTRDVSPARGELRIAWGSQELSTDWVVR